MPRKYLLLNLFTIILVVALILTQQAWATPLMERFAAATEATSKTTMNYQGYLTDSGGAPVNDTLSMVFRIYDVESGGTALWSETQNSVVVSDGLFSVLLGSETSLTESIFHENPSLWLGTTVGSDEEMAPRELLSSAPFALTGGIPSGAVIMWSGDIATIPAGWQLCDGTNGTANLVDRFVVGAGNAYAVNTTGGATQVTLTTNQMPTHSHTASSGTNGSIQFSQSDNHGGGIFYGNGTIHYENNQNMGAHSHTITVNETGGGQAHENRPPYWALAFICKQ